MSQKNHKVTIGLMTHDGESAESYAERLQQLKDRIEDHRSHMLACLTGARAMLSHLFYAQATPEHSAWMRSMNNNHDAGGVMDHLASLIESLTPEPGDREPFFPAPECNACGNCTPCRCDGTGNG